MLYVASETFGSLFAMQKVNILIYRINKLSMKNFVEFLKSEFAEEYKGW